MTRRIAVLLAGIVTVVATASALGGCAGSDDSGPSTTTPAPSLDGTWAVTALLSDNGDSLLTGPFADKLQLTFKNGEMTGNSGCNSIFGPYLHDGDTLDFSSERSGTTLVGCDEPPLLQRLQAVRFVSGEGDVRSLQSATRATIVELRRS